jgi:hypothetical protein
VKDIAIVDIFFDSPFVTQLKRDVRTTYAGKISNIGTPELNFIVLKIFS